MDTKERLKHINRKVAISVAILSTVMAVSKVKDDNVVQAMLQAKTDALDTWNEYQSKKIKHHLAESASAQNEALKLIVPAKAAAFLERQNRKYRADLARYEGEEKDLMARARGFEGKYDSLNFLDDQFDMSDAALSISMMLLAVSALTAETWLLYTSWGLGSIGILFSISAFVGWKFHPDWLVKLLS